MPSDTFRCPSCDDIVMIASRSLNAAGEVVGQYVPVSVSRPVVRLQCRHYICEACGHAASSSGTLSCPRCWMPTATADFVRLSMPPRGSHSPSLFNSTEPSIDGRSVSQPHQPTTTSVGAAAAHAVAAQARPAIDVPRLPLGPSFNSNTAVSLRQSGDAVTATRGSSVASTTSNSTIFVAPKPQRTSAPAPSGADSSNAIVPPSVIDSREPSASRVTRSDASTDSTQGIAPTQSQQLSSRNAGAATASGSSPSPAPKGATASAARKRSEQQQQPSPSPLPRPVEGATNQRRLSATAMESFVAPAAATAREGRAAASAATSLDETGQVHHAALLRPNPAAAPSDEEVRRQLVRQVEVLGMQRATNATTSRQRSPATGVSSANPVPPSLANSRTVAEPAPSVARPAAAVAMRTTGAPTMARAANVFVETQPAIAGSEIVEQQRLQQRQQRHVVTPDIAVFDRLVTPPTTSSITATSNASNTALFSSGAGVDVAVLQQALQGGAPQEVPSPVALATPLHQIQHHHHQGHVSQPQQRRSQLAGDDTSDSQQKQRQEQHAAQQQQQQQQHPQLSRHELNRQRSEHEHSQDDSQERLELYCLEDGVCLSLRDVARFRGRTLVSLPEAVAVVRPRQLAWLEQQRVKLARLDAETERVAHAAATAQAMTCEEVQHARSGFEELRRRLAEAERGAVARIEAHGAEQSGALLRTQQYLQQQREALEAAVESVASCARATSPRRVLAVRKPADIVESIHVTLPPLLPLGVKFLFDRFRTDDWAPFVGGSVAGLGRSPLRRPRGSSGGSTSAVGASTTASGLARGGGRRFGSGASSRAGSASGASSGRSASAHSAEPRGASFPPVRGTATGAYRRTVSHPALSSGVTARSGAAVASTSGGFARARSGGAVSTNASIASSVGVVSSGPENTDRWGRRPNSGPAPRRAATSDALLAGKPVWSFNVRPQMPASPGHR